MKNSKIISERLLLLVLISGLITCFFSVGCQTQKVLTPVTLGITPYLNSIGFADGIKGALAKDASLNLKVVSKEWELLFNDAANGAVDVLVINNQNAEQNFVSDGFGLSRIEYMYDYFLLIGPPDDPAGIIKSLKRDEKATGTDSLKLIYKTKSNFISLGENSTVYDREQALWNNAGLMPTEDWYMTIDKDINEVLSLAVDKKSYILVERGYYLAESKKLDLKIIADQVPDLYNQYTIIQANSAKWLDSKGNPKLNKAAGDALVKWLLSNNAINLINKIGKADYGENLFKVNYNSKQNK